MAPRLRTRQQQGGRASSLLLKIDGIEAFWKYTLLIVDAREPWIQSVQRPITQWKERVIDDEKIRDQLLAVLGEDRDAWNTYAVQVARKATGKEVDSDILSPREANVKAIELTTSAAKQIAKEGKGFEAYLNGSKIDMWVCDCAVRLLFTIVKEFQDGSDGYFSRLIGAPKPAMHRMPSEPPRRKLVQGIKRCNEDDEGLFVPDERELKLEEALFVSDGVESDLTARDSDPEAISSDGDNEVPSQLSGVEGSILKRSRIDETDRDADETAFNNSNKRFRLGKTQHEYDPREKMEAQLGAEPSSGKRRGPFIEYTPTPEPEDQQSGTETGKPSEMRGQSAAMNAHVDAVDMLREDGASDKPQDGNLLETSTGDRPRAEAPQQATPNGLRPDLSNNQIQGENSDWYGMVIKQLNILHAQAGVDFNRVDGMQSSLAQLEVGVQGQVQELKRMVSQMANEMVQSQQEVMRLKLQRERLLTDNDEAEAKTDRLQQILRANQQAAGERFRELESKNLELELTNAELEHKNAKLEDKCAEWKRDFRQLNADHVEASETYATANCERERLKFDMERKNATVEKLSKDVHDLKNDAGHSVEGYLCEECLAIARQKEFQSSSPGGCLALSPRQ